MRKTLRMTERQSYRYNNPFEHHQDIGNITILRNNTCKGKHKHDLNKSNYAYWHEHVQSTPFRRVPIVDVILKQKINKKPWHIVRTNTAKTLTCHITCMPNVPTAHQFQIPEFKKKQIHLHYQTHAAHSAHQRNHDLQLKKRVVWFQSKKTNVSLSLSLSVSFLSHRVTRARSERPPARQTVLHTWLQRA